MSKDQDKIAELNRKRIEQIALDFIVNDKHQRQIMEDYNLSYTTVVNIIKRLDLVKKRDKYRAKVLDKSLERCANYQSKIIYKATEILHKHIDDISVKARKQANVALSSTEIRDVMAILAIISKEYRLDHDKPTDRTVKEVKVEFPEGFSPITSKADVIVDADFKDVEPEEKKEEEIQVDTNIIGNPLE